MNWPKLEQLRKDNSHLIPRGLASLNRKVHLAIAFVRAKGAHLWDLDWRGYTDYHADFIPYLLSYKDDDRIAAVARTVAEGLSSHGTEPTREEGDLTLLFLRAMPHAEKVQFFNMGSEATLQANAGYTSNLFHCPTLTVTT